jgi:hypothetical protein
MATLVLTVAGGVIGGPIGAALGGMLGQAVDRQVLFKPKRGEGPRLTELAVQTSAYGTALPWVFGTMRIGGCVIWATDLIEHRSSSSSSKGQPKATSYSYSASFAVALSGRTITGVGRIWADGKLLRGSAGDLKSQTGFRLHLGGEDQAVDPLIAAAEGGLAPAHRGIAYAVFEDFQLADYGNRIPSLTFEVIADPVATRAGDIAAAVSRGIVAAGEAEMPLSGFAAYGDVPAVLDLLASASGSWFAPAGRSLRMRAIPVPRGEIVDGGVAVGDTQGQRSSRAITAIESVPRSVTLAHYDPARDYQSGLQRAQRPGPGRRELRIEMPAALSADAAKTMAEALVARTEAARERRIVTLGWHDLRVAPGDVVTIRDTPGVFRVTDWSFEAMVVKLECVRVSATTAAAGATSGRVLAAPDAVAGPTILHVFEMPPLDDMVLNAPRMFVAACGRTVGWRQAALLYGMAGEARWTPIGRTAGAATLGMLASAPGTGPTSLIDRVNNVVVDLAHEDMGLVGADIEALVAGANIAMAGDELLQFGTAEQIGRTRWRLSDLLRGRRGTEGAVGRQRIGDRFVLIDPDTLAPIDLPLSAVGGTVRVLASGIGDLSGPVSMDATVQGSSVLPPSPVHLTSHLLPGGDALVRWVRRSRGGWRWIDGVDAPLGEEREVYRVTIAPTGGPPRDLDVMAPEIVISALDRVAGSCVVSVRQVGSNGESAATTIDLPIMQETT